MRTEKEIRLRIKKLDKKLRRKVKINTQKRLEKEGMKGMMLLAERYGLWWVLGEVRKRQGHAVKDGTEVKT